MHLGSCEILFCEVKVSRRKIARGELSLAVPVHWHRPRVPFQCSTEVHSRLEGWDWIEAVELGDHGRLCRIRVKRVLNAMLRTEFGLYSVGRGKEPLTSRVEDWAEMKTQEATAKW